MVANTVQDEDADRDGPVMGLGPGPRIATAEREAMRGERAPCPATTFALRVKENLLLLITALVMCIVYYVRQEGIPWADGIGAFVWRWLGCYAVLILVLLLVYVLSAAADKYLFGERDSRKLRETGHQPTVYACLAVLAISLVLLLFR